MFLGSFIQQHHLFLFTCVETSEDKCWSEQVCSGVGSNIRTQPQEAQTNRNYRTLNELQHMNTQRVDRHTEASRSYKHYTHTHTHTCSNFSLARKSTTTIKHCREESSGSGEQTGCAPCGDEAALLQDTTHPHTTSCSRGSAQATEHKVG